MRNNIFRKQLSKIKRFCIWVVLVIALDIPVATAHGFGVRHQLEIPLYYYVLGAGLTVIMSFVVAAVFLTKKSPESFAEKQPFRWRYEGPGQKLLSRQMGFGIPLLQALSLSLFFLIIFSGLFGQQSPTQNLAPILIWSLWWAGMVYVQALIGDVWRLINPWSLLFSGLEKISFLKSLVGHFVYPERWSCWPAVVIFWFFAWLEQVAPFSEKPVTLVQLILAYSAITFTAMFLFGREKWLAKGEAFSLLFTFLARMAPTETKSENDKHKSRLWLRPAGVGLLVDKPLDRAATSLILLLLASVTFDGFRDTTYWADIVHWLLVQPMIFSPLFKIQQAGIDLLVFFETMGLLLTPVIFFLSYGIISFMSSQLANHEQSPRVLSGSFVLTLVPISFAYHIAHYLTFLLLAGQLAIPLFSDPFHLGWDLMGTLGRQMNVGIIGISTTWWVAVGAVVIGHVYAVYLAHVMALRLFSSVKRALISQTPLIILMVCYTMMSLWILAQPIVVAD